MQAIGIVRARRRVDCNAFDEPLLQADRCSGHCRCTRTRSSIGPIFDRFAEDLEIDCFGAGNCLFFSNADGIPSTCSSSPLALLLHRRGGLDDYQSNHTSRVDFVLNFTGLARTKKSPWKVEITHSMFGLPDVSTLVVLRILMVFHLTS